MPRVDTAPMGQVPRRLAAKSLQTPRFKAGVAAIVVLLVAAACGGPAERPDTQEVSGTTEYMVSEAGAARSGSAPCEHGTVVECKVWITDVDCFTGLAVCDLGEWSGCMDADSAETTLEALDQDVE